MKQSKAKTIKECKCDKCGKEWFPKKPGKPNVCPGCKNPNWNKGPKRPGGRGRKKGIEADHKD